jgi:hypothetical protein
MMKWCDRHVTSYEASVGCMDCHACEIEESEKARRGPDLRSIFVVDRSDPAVAQFRNGCFRCKTAIVDHGEQEVASGQLQKWSRYIELEQGSVYAVAWLCEPCGRYAARHDVSCIEVDNWLTDLGHELAAAGMLVATRTAPWSQVTSPRKVLARTVAVDVGHGDETVWQVQSFTHDRVEVVKTYREHAKPARWDFIGYREFKPAPELAETPELAERLKAVILKTYPLLGEYIAYAKRDADFAMALNKPFESEPATLRLWKGRTPEPGEPEPPPLRFPNFPKIDPA